jgi:hypothetical protein
MRGAYVGLIDIVTQCMGLGKENFRETLSLKHIKHALNALSGITLDLAFAVRSSH